MGVFVFTRVVNTFFPNFWSKLSCIFKMCEHHIEKLKAEKYIVDFEPAYSSNIYKEITIDDLKREFEKTQTELNDYKGVLEGGQIKREHKAVEYMLKQYETKVMTIKELLNRWLK